MRILEVAEYSPEWVKRYQDESAILRSIFGANLADIQHIGSTSVPGLKAKPTVDILIAAKDLEEVDRISHKLEDIGYKVHGEFGISGRRFFSKIKYVGTEDWVNIFHVHVFHESDVYNINRHLSVREFLRAHPERASEYGNLKAEIALKFPHDGEGYSNAKGDFIKDLEKEALDWYKNNRK